MKTKYLMAVNKENIIEEYFIRGYRAGINGGLLSDLKYLLLIQGPIIRLGGIKGRSYDLGRTAGETKRNKQKNLKDTLEG